MHTNYILTVKTIHEFISFSRAGLHYIFYTILRRRCFNSPTLSEKVGRIRRKNEYTVCDELIPKDSADILGSQYYKGALTREHPGGLRTVLGRNSFYPHTQMNFA